MAKLKHDNMLFDDIVLFQILPKLPARSIGRFMSVCKQWHSFLKTPTFTKMHLHHVISQNRHKLLAVSTTTPCKYFRTIDPEVGLSANRSLPFEANRMLMISSSNGLVCVGINATRSRVSGVFTFSDIILWNPLMGEYKTLSKGNNCSGIAARVFGLYYSSCDDDYKLLRLTESNDAYIYSWKSDSWRKAKSTVDSLMQFWCLSSFLNEKLYFIAQGTQGSSSKGCSLIIRFDTKTEMFTEIATPFLQCVNMNMMVVEGCIHLCVVLQGYRYKLELWKMDGDGEWKKVIRSSMLPFQSIPCHLMKNGNLFLLYTQKMVYVYELDPEMRKEAIEVCRYYIDDDTMGILRGGKFIESIVSPKR